MVALAIVACVAVTAGDARAQGRRTTKDPERPATLTGYLYDPLGGGAEDIPISLERICCGGDGPPALGTKTDKTGHYRFDKMWPGVYLVTAPIDFVPATRVEIKAGESVEHDIRMELEPVEATITICAECAITGQSYTPPDSIVKEFAQDRDAAWEQPVKAAEPIGGWEFYRTHIVDYPETLRELELEGTVVLEGTIGADGFPTGLRVVSSPRPELGEAALAAVAEEAWSPARVRGVAIEVPVRLTVEYTLRQPGR